MERFYKDLRKHAAKIITYEKKKEKKPLTVKENKIYHEQKVCYIFKKDLVLMMTIKNIKSEITVIILENTEVLLIIFVI